MSKMASIKGDVSQYRAMSLNQALKRKIKGAGKIPVAAKALPYRTPARA